MSFIVQTMTKFNGSLVEKSQDMCITHYTLETHPTPRTMTETGNLFKILHFSGPVYDICKNPKITSNDVKGRQSNMVLYKDGRQTLK